MCNWQEQEHENLISYNSNILLPVPLNLETAKGKQKNITIANIKLIMYSRHDKHSIENRFCQSSLSFFLQHKNILARSKLQC